MVCLFKGGLSAPKCSGVVCQLRDVRECFATSGSVLPVQECSGEGCQFRSVQERVASSGVFRRGLPVQECSGEGCQFRSVQERVASSGVFCQFRSVQERVASSGVVCQLTNVSILTANFVPLNAPLPLCSNQQNVFPLSVFHD